MNANLFALFERAFPADRARVALATPAGGSLSYAAIDAGSARLAGLLATLGLQPGDRVSVQVPKSAEAVLLYLACLRGGFVFHPLNDAYRQAELAWLVADASPALVVCDPAAADLFGAIAPAGCRVMTLADDGSGSLMAAAAATTALPATVVRKSSDLAILLYTSGTTGTPKGAMITHGNLAANVLALVEAWGFGPADRLLHALPLYHAHGLFVGLGCALASGASLLLLPRFDAAAVLAALPACTVMMGVPTYYTRLLQQPGLDRAACTGVRLFISGSAPLAPATFAAFRERTGHEVLERYGMTETGMNTSNPLHGERRPGSVGPPLPGVSVRITGSDGQPLPAGATGEIELRGPNVFAGYWRQPDKSAEAFTADGWFRTGDQGHIDGDGYLTISGRSKDLVISGGLNVYPREVELALEALPDVAEAAVIGAPHPEFGEAVVAVVVARADARPAEAVIIRALKDRLAAYKVPKRVFIVPELPRNAMGKIEKTTLRQRHAATFATQDPPG